MLLKGHSTDKYDCYFIVALTSLKTCSTQKVEGWLNYLFSFLQDKLHSVGTNNEPFTGSQMYLILISLHWKVSRTLLVDHLSIMGAHNEVEMKCVVWQQHIAHLPVGLASELSSVALGASGHFLKLCRLGLANVWLKYIKADTGIRAKWSTDCFLVLCRALYCCVFTSRLVWILNSSNEQDSSQTRIAIPRSMWSKQF